MKHANVPRFRPAAVLAAVALTTGCAAQGGSSDVPSAWRATPVQLRVRVFEGGRAAIKRVALEDYVRGSIVSEFAPAGGDAGVVVNMLQIQAVLSRTYAVSHLRRHARDGYDLCATTHCQLYEPARLGTSRWTAAAAAAVRKTAGRVLWFEHAPAAVLFHADCGGHTSSPEAIWGGEAPQYLRAGVDDGPAANAHATWRYRAAHDAMRLALNADARTAVGRRLSDIAVLERDEAGRAVRLRLAGERTRVVRGEVLRDVLTRAFGSRSIKSTWFQVEAAGPTWMFEGRGFGHGAGLCQAGAVARLTAGSSPSAVLLHYFPSTRLRALR